MQYYQVTTYFNLNENSLASTIESLKQHVVAVAGSLSRYRKQALRHKQNRMFHANQQLLFKQFLNNNSSADSLVPDSREIVEFWKSIWSCQKTHNQSARWLKTLKSEFTSFIVMQDDIVISANKVTQYCKRMCNWKAPGLDQLHGFWIKHLQSLHSRIAVQLHYVFTHGPPDWMTLGRTVLVVKDAVKGSIPSNFRPITCLPTIWKLLSGILSDCLYNHLHSQGLLPTEQKGISRGSRGAKSQLLVDKMIMKEAKQRHKNLQMLWLDYKKAYDSVPHSWILECLRLLRAHQSLCHFLKQAMHLRIPFLELLTSTVGFSRVIASHLYCLLFH